MASKKKKVVYKWDASSSKESEDTMASRLENWKEGKEMMDGLVRDGLVRITKRARMAIATMRGPLETKGQVLSVTSGYFVLREVCQNSKDMYGKMMRKDSGNERILSRSSAKSLRFVRLSGRVCISLSLSLSLSPSTLCLCLDSRQHSRQKG